MHLWRRRQDVQSHPDGVQAAVCALHTALFEGYSEVMHVLLAPPSSVTANSFKAGCDRSLLQAAVEQNSLEMVRLLISYGASSIYQSSDKCVALHFACFSSTGQILRTLLDAPLGMSVIDHKDNNGDTPLTLAAMRGARSSCKMLLDAGAAVNARNKHGCTPYQRAKEHPDVQALLRQYGAYSW